MSKEKKVKAGVKIIPDMASTIESKPSQRTTKQGMKKPSIPPIGMASRVSKRTRIRPVVVLLVLFSVGVI